MADTVNDRTCLIDVIPSSVPGVTMGTLATKYSKDSSHLYFEDCLATKELIQSYPVLRGGSLNMAPLDEFSTTLASLALTTKVCEDEESS